MELRAMTASDLPRLDDIDATIESMQYIHIERSGEGISMGWRLEERALREKLIQPLRMSDDIRFLAKQVASGADEGLAVVGEHEGAIVAMMLARPDPERKTLILQDLRVDYDYRRQGLATALVFQVIQQARDMELRAAMAETRTNNIAAAKLMAKCGFELAGIDTHRETNHDLVKEAATLLWYAALSQ